MKDQELIPLYMRFSERKRQIIEMVASGKSNEAVARHLYIAPCTVAEHLTEIYGEMSTWESLSQVRPNRHILISVFAPFFDRHPVMRHPDLGLREAWSSR